MARPTIYSDELATEIITRICAGESVRSICNDPQMPARSTVMLWVAEDREGFSDRYAKACEARAHYWADELLDIADDSANDYMERADKEGGVEEVLNPEAIARSRLRVDTRKWLLSKMLPRYADRQALEHTSPDGSMTPRGLDASKLSTETLKELMAARGGDSS